MKLHELRVEGFRGIGAEQRIRLDGEHLLLFGDNGTGKSSFVEGLEYALTGAVDNLTGIAGVSVQKHAPHVRSGEKMKVELTFKDGGQSYVCQTDSSVPPGLGDLADAAKSGVVTLRRRKLLDFIEQQPRDRYEALRPFLGFGGFNALEAALKRAKEAATEAHDATKRHAAEVRAAFGQLQLDPARGDMREALRQVVSTYTEQAGLPPPLSLDDVPVLRNEVRRRLQDRDQTQGLREVSQRLNDYGDVLLQRQTVQNWVTFQQAPKEAGVNNQSPRTQDAGYTDLLDAARRWIQREERPDCPVCEQRIDHMAVVERLAERLERAAAAAMSPTAAPPPPTEAAVLRYLAQLSAQGEAARKAWIANMGDVPWPFVDEENIRAEAETAGGDLLEVLERWLAWDVRSAFHLAQGYLEDATTRHRAQLAPLQELDRVCGQLESASTAITKLESVHHELQQLAHRAQVAAQLYQAAVQARKHATQEVFEQIQGDIQGLYARIHPGEDELGDLYLEVSPTTRSRGSAVLRARFYDQQAEDPRAYFSESHLDTLGLCVWFAMRRRLLRRHPSCTLIVLDDVLTSVDGGHRQRIAELMVDEIGRDFQLVVTTHDRIWFEHMKRRFQGRAVCRAIRGWNIDHGPRIVNSVTDMERLRRAKGEERSLREVVPIAGVVLESILSEMRFSFRCRIETEPDDRYTLRPLLTAAKDRVRKLRKRGVPLAGTLTEALDEAEKVIDLRNWTGHWNEWAQSLTESELERFVDAVIWLYEATRCEQCRGALSLRKEPYMITCKKGCNYRSADGQAARS